MNAQYLKYYETYKRYRLNNKEALVKKAAKWKKSNPEKVKESNRRTAKKWYRNNPEEARRKSRKYRLANPSKIKEAARRWYNTNKHRLTDSDREQKAAYLREYAKKNRAKLQQYKKSYRNHNPWHARLLCQKRRALEKQAAGNLELITYFIDSVKSKSGAICYYCQKRVSVKKIHFDHIIPLSKGGQHSVDNLCVSCAPCNLSKHARSPQTWIKVGQQLLPL